jgi:hypothetical protein
MNKQFRILMRVNNLDLCRGFYRDILNLGEPQLDSTFAVAFSLNNGAELVLEKTQSCYLEHGCSAISLVLEVDDNEFEAIRRRLEDNCGATLTEVTIFGDSTALRGNDPEGNFFYLHRFSSAAQ